MGPWLSRFGVILALSGASVFAVAQTVSPPSAPSVSQSATQDERGSEQAPFFVRVITSEKPPETGNPENPCEKPADREWGDLCQQWRMANAAKEQIELLGRQNGLVVHGNELLAQQNGMIAAGNALFGRQNELLEKQNDLMLIEGALVSAGLIATGIGLFQTARTNRRTDTTTRAELRAYVYTEKYRLIMPIERNRPVGSFLINNKGRLPAKNVRHFGVTQVCEWPLPDDFEFPTVTAWAKGNLSSFEGISNEARAPSDRPVTDDEARALQAKTHRLTMFGLIEYNDGFENGRTTRFCLSLVDSFEYLTMVGEPGEKVGFNWQYADRYNDHT